MARRGAIAAAAALANMGEGQSSALLFEVRPRPFDQPDGFMMPEARSQISERAHKAFVQEEARLEARLAREGRSRTTTSLATLAPHVGERASEAVRCAELGVIGGPLTGLKLQLFEGVLFGSEWQPHVIAPDWRAGGNGRSVIITWNAGRDAAHAVAPATPLLECADKVTIHTAVTEADDDPPRAPPDAPAAPQRRRGLAAEARAAERRGRPGAEALIEVRRKPGADLIVMGADGRARLQDIVFGGLTRTLIGDSTAPPLLMAH